MQSDIPREMELRGVIAGALHLSKHEEQPSPTGEDLSNWALMVIWSPMRKLVSSMAP